MARDPHEKLVVFIPGPWPPGALELENLAELLAHAARRLVREQGDQFIQTVCSLKYEDAQ